MAQQLNFAAKAMMSGVLVYALWIWALVKGHEHEMAHLWLLAFLPPAALGFLIGRHHRWAFLAVAAGPLIFVFFNGWRFVDGVLAFGVPMALGGAVAVGARRVLRHMAA